MTAPIVPLHVWLRDEPMRRLADTLRTAIDEDDRELADAVRAEVHRRATDDERPTEPPPPVDPADAPLFVGGPDFSSTPLLGELVEAPSTFETVIARAVQLVERRGLTMRDALRAARAGVCT